MKKQACSVLTLCLALSLLTACQQDIVQTVTIDKALIASLLPAQVRALSGELQLEGNKIAVLPFSVTAVGHPEYQSYGVGMSDTAATSLSGIKEFVTIDRSMLEAALSAKSIKFDEKIKPESALEVCRELNVGTLIAGELLVDKDQYGVTYRVINTGNGKLLKAIRFTAKSIMEAQDLLAQHISALKGHELSPTQQSTVSKIAQGTQSQKAYSLYIQARNFFFSTLTLSVCKTSLNLVDQALREDPAYTIAKAFKAEILIQMFNLLQEAESFDVDLGAGLLDGETKDSLLAKAKQQAQEARDQAPDLGFVYRALGVIDVSNGNIQGAISNQRKAVSLLPNDPYSHIYLFYAEALADPTTLRPDNPYLSKAFALNPQLFEAFVLRAGAFAAQGKSSEAVKDYQASILFAPSDVHAALSHVALANLYLSAKNFGLVDEHYGLAVSLLDNSKDKDDPYVRLLSGSLYAIWATLDTPGKDLQLADQNLLKAKGRFNLTLTTTQSPLGQRLANAYYQLAAIHYRNNGVSDPQIRPLLNTACSLGSEAACSTLTSPDT